MGLQQKATLTVATNTYIDRTTGKQKRFQREIGSIMVNDEGHEFIFLDKYLNLAAIPSDPDKSHLYVNIVPTEEKQTTTHRQSRSKHSKTAQKAAQELLSTKPFDDDIGF